MLHRSNCFVVLVGTALYLIVITQVGEGAYHEPSYLNSPQQPWGRAQGHYQGQMGTFNPITGHWTQEPENPEYARSVCLSRSKRQDKTYICCAQHTEVIMTLLYATPKQPWFHIEIACMPWQCWHLCKLFAQAEPITKAQKLGTSQILQHLWTCGIG